MINVLRYIIKETIEENSILCEVKIDIEDEKKRGFADAIGQQYKDSLKELKPIKIKGKLGIDDISRFVITLMNGDIIYAIRSVNPAFANININKGAKEIFVNSKEMFSNKFPEIIKKYYLAYKTAKAGIPSI
jgi:hypothetical protein